MRWARTGPTPGRSSNWSGVAALRSSGVPGAVGDPPPGGAGADGAGARTPTGICSPSTSLRARLRVPVFAPGRAPPAALIASATREPEGSVTTPGCLTLPRTCTTTEDDAAAGLTGGAGRGSASETVAVGAADGWGR